MKSLRQVWAAAQGNPRNPKIAKRARLPQAEDSAPMRVSRIGSPIVPRAKHSKKRESGSEATLIPLTRVKTAAKRRRESEGIIPSGGS